MDRRAPVAGGINFAINWRPYIHACMFVMLCGGIEVRGDDATEAGCGIGRECELQCASEGSDAAPALNLW
jgi:hypothetical protein